MAESPPDLLQEVIKINISKCRGLEGSKGGPFIVTAKVEFNNNVLGESAKIEILNPTDYVPLQFECDMTVDLYDPMVLDELTKTPIVVTFTEILPKDKKQKEDKFITLGHCCIDLLPLLRGMEVPERSSLVCGVPPENSVILRRRYSGETQISRAEHIHASVTNAGESNEEQALPEVDLTISTSKPLLDQERRESCNLLTVCVESLYSLPESWNNAGTPYIYSVCMPIPLTEEKETTVLIPNGCFRNAGEKEKGRTAQDVDVQNQVHAGKGCFSKDIEVKIQETSEQRKWSSAPGASGSCLYIPNTEIHHCHYQEETGDLSAKEVCMKKGTSRDVDVRNQHVGFRTEAEYHKAHVTWNSERRCFLSKISVQCLQQKIATHRYWPLEIIRTALVANTKGGKTKEEEPQSSFHGVIYIDLAPLLYPGVKTLRGAYLVHPFNEAEINERFQRKGIINEDVMRAIAGAHRSGSALGNQSKNAKLIKPEMPKVKEKGTSQDVDVKNQQSIAVIKSDGTVDELGEVALQEGQQYVEARSYIILELELEKPMVNKRTDEEITVRIAELIPPRPAFPKKEGGSKKAVDDFESEVVKTADLLLEEFREMFGSDFAKNMDGADERRKALLYNLNTSGKYYAFKEKLKEKGTSQDVDVKNQFYIVKIVREKFMYKTKFTSIKEQQEFISQLYVFLMDHMHKGLNKFVSTEEAVEVPPDVKDPKMLKHFAIEAEVMFRFDLAAKYYKERVTRNKDSPEAWFDYGVFCLSINDIQRAEECFKEVVSIDQKHMKGLALNSVLALLHEDFAVVEDFLDSSTYIYPDEIVPWTLLGLFYNGVENTIMSERCFNEANRLLNILISPQTSEETTPDEGPLTIEIPIEESVESYGSSQESKDTPRSEVQSKETTKDATTVSSVKSVVQDPRSIFLIVAKFLLESHCLQLAERALAHELVLKKNVPGELYYELLGELDMLKKCYDDAIQSFDQALKMRHANPRVWAFKGHVYYIKQDYSAAKDCYERCFAYTADAGDMHAIYIRLANIYLDTEKEYKKAKSTFLKVCETSPSCITWLGVGIACYKLDELSDAEQALNEANILENQNPDVWAYLTLVCLKQMRHSEAEQCYKYAIKLGFCDNKVLDEIQTTMDDVKFDMSVL